MKSTKDRILQFLLGNPNSTINELAKIVGINAISVRHHLTNLQAEGLVAAQEERHGVGRPRLVYYLTEKGLERFPSRYLRLTNNLLSELKESLPEEKIRELFERMAENMSSEFTGDSKTLEMEKRLENLKQFMDSEGFSVDWEKRGGKYQIKQIACPYYQISQLHPEVCSLGQKIITEFLALDSERITCILSGDAHCTFSIDELAA